MTPPRKLLVPVDFSAPSSAAFEYAVELARRFDAKLDVVHVWEAPVFVPPVNMPEAGVADVGLIELVRKNAESALDGFVADARKRGIAIGEGRVEAGRPAQAIVELAASEGYDLIVIGTHGRTGLSHALIGSVAERVVRHAPCPVLTVRTRVA